MKCGTVSLVNRAPITSFSGAYFFLSNFYPTLTFFEERFYPSAEHAFQAAKTLLPAERKKIADASTASEAKQLGKTVRLRRGWDQIKERIMYEVLKGKFHVRHDLCVHLEKTEGRDLIEGNTWGDREWGCIWVNEKLMGENKLGRLLMKLRENLWKTQEE